MNDTVVVVVVVVVSVDGAVEAAQQRAEERSGVTKAKGSVQKCTTLHCADTLALHRCLRSATQ